MFQIDLSGRTAVITGGGRGLGYEIARVLAECGAGIVIADRLEENVASAVQELSETGVHTFGTKTDVTSEADMQALFKAAADQTGRIDIVVNCAGIGVIKEIGAISPDEIKQEIDVNIMGTEYGCRLALEYMKEQRHGKVVNITSTAGRMGQKPFPHYAMTKAAVINLTQSYALAAAEYGINYNAVAPGIIRTPMWEMILDVRSGDSEDADRRNEIWDKTIKRSIPMGIAQEPIDIANAVAFLVSDQARYITGQTLNVCGGMRLN